MWTSLTLLGAIAGALSDPTGAPVEPACLMAPIWHAIEVAERGFHWLPGEFDEGTCEPIAGPPFQQGGAADYELQVWADGPGGSGRYWEVTVGLAGQPGSAASRGFCFMTTTVGWRTLQGFRDGPLPWVEDVDGDGRPELVVWNSFPLDASESPAAQAIAAWAYDVESPGRLVLDVESSRKLAHEIAGAYRRPRPLADAWHDDQRRRAARSLESFADGECRLAAE
jgi:hypothetical protein